MNIRCRYCGAFAKKDKNYSDDAINAICCNRCKKVYPILVGKWPPTIPLYMKRMLADLDKEEDMWDGL